MEEEKKLLQEQMAYKARFARFIENTNKIGVANLTFDILSARMELLEKYWNQALLCHKKLNLHMLALADEEYFSSDMFFDYESDYVVAKAYLSGKLGQCIENVQRLQQNAAPPNAMELRSISASIPKLERPKFNGKQEEWETFKEAFTAMFKDDPNLMPNLKLQHLISCLKGDAARRIANFKVTGANFDVAWQALCRRYDNKRLRLSTHMNMLIKAPPMSKKSVPEISRLLDITDQCIRAMKALSRPVEHWDDWLIQLIVMKLDSSIREDWEKSLEGSNDFPTYYQLVSFLENRIQSIETAKLNESSSSVNKTKSSQQSRHIAAHVTSDDANSTAEEKRKPSSPSCVLCKGDHYINYCPKFTQDDVAARRDIAKRNQLCFNCLRKKHTSSNCSSKYRCKTCGSKHHTLLHDEDDEGQETSNSTTACHSSESITTVRAKTIIAQQSTLLGTAIIQLTNKTGERIEARALIDPCSERCFITERVAQLLSLPKMPFKLTVSGVGALPTATSKHTVHVSIQSNIDSNFILSISAAVLTRLTQQLPRQSLKRASWPHLQGLTLADPDYATSKSVDCILGADAYAAIMMEGLLTGPPGTPLAQNTWLGWILTGPVDSNAQAGSAVSFTTLTDAQESLSDQLWRFWEVEEIMPAKAQLTADEQDCEEQFIHGHQRDESGRYVVCLPFREQPLLTGSRQIATRHLMQTEHRLQRNHKVREAYCKFMYEYEALSHMKRLGNEQSSKPDTNYIPHHAVLRSGSDKIRVVFDAAQVCGEKSLNYFLHPGPKLQADIMTMLSRWWIFRYVFSADIVKMFRQIRVHPDDMKWQRIVWRNAPTEALADYKLLTVTYGTACAPYFVNRVLKQLAIDEGDRFPIGAKIIRENTYVDDALAGGHTEAEALQAQRQLIDMLSSAGMNLDKWSANFELIIPSDNKSPSERKFAMPDNVSILGLRWIPHEDAFTYHVQPTTATAMITKRIILSYVAKLYDPMG